MKISEQTLAILKNFASINQGIVFHPGNVIKVVTQSAGSYQAQATVEETFPKACVVGDIGRLVTLLKMFDEPEIEFDEKNLVITDGSGRSLTYRYTEPKLIKAPNYDGSIKFTADTDIHFSIDADWMKTMDRALAGMKATHLGFVSDGDQLIAATWNEADPRADQFSYKIQPCKQIFNLYYKVEYLKMIDQAYDVTLCVEKMFVKFDGNPTYWIPGDQKSKVFK